MLKYALVSLQGHLISSKLGQTKLQTGFFQHWKNFRTKFLNVRITTEMALI